MIIHVDQYGVMTEHSLAMRRDQVKITDPGGPNERVFKLHRENMPCPSCLGLSTDFNSTFDCVRCGNRGEIEVDTTTEVTSL